MHKRTSPPIESRIRDAVIIDPETSCWNWTGGKDGNGYGRISYLGKPTYTHRVSYEIFVGPIPDDLQIDHLCRNTSCCNPDHLETVTIQTNLARRAMPPTCRRGHDNSDVYISSAGRKTCRACRNLRKSGYRAIARQDSGR